MAPPAPPVSAPACPYYDPHLPSSSNTEVWLFGKAQF